MTNFNSSRIMNWSDIKLTYKWLQQIKQALKGEIKFSLPGVEKTELTISNDTGAKDDVIKFVNSTIRDFKDQYELDEDGNRINIQIN